MIRPVAEVRSMRARSRSFLWLAKTTSATWPGSRLMPSSSRRSPSRAPTKRTTALHSCVGRSRSSRSRQRSMRSISASDSRRSNRVRPTLGRRQTACRSMRRSSRTVRSSGPGIYRGMAASPETPTRGGSAAVSIGCSVRTLKRRAGQCGRSSVRPRRSRVTERSPPPREGDEVDCAWHADGARGVADLVAHIKLSGVLVDHSGVRVAPVVEPAHAVHLHAAQLRESTDALRIDERLQRAPALLALGAEQGERAPILAGAHQLHEHRFAEGGVGARQRRAGGAALVVGDECRGASPARRRGRGLVALHQGRRGQRPAAPEGAGVSVDEVGPLLSGETSRLLTAAEEALQETRSAHQAAGRGAAVMSAATLASVLGIQVSVRVRRGRPARPDRQPGRGPARYHPQVMGMRARILLAEDQASVAAPVVSRLIEAGHEVKWVRQMRELRRQMDDNPPDLLLLDTTLDVDGLEYFQAVRFSPDHPRAGVVILTPPGDVRTKERALQLGAAAVLAKPLDEDALVAVVGDLLSMI